MTHKEELIVNAIWGSIKNPEEKRTVTIIISLYLIGLKIKKARFLN